MTCELETNRCETNGEPIEEVDCLKYWRSQLTAGIGCEMDMSTQNE